MIEINFRPTTTVLRQFAAILAGLLALAGAWLAFRWGSLPWAAAVWGLALVSAATGWLKPASMRIIFVAWMIAAFPVGWLVSQLLLAMVFYLVITPLGLVLRLLGHDPLCRRFDPSTETYWKPHASCADYRRYFRQF